MYLCKEFEHIINVNMKISKHDTDFGKEEEVEMRRNTRENRH